MKVRSRLFALIVVFTSICIIGAGVSRYFVSAYMYSLQDERAQYRTLVLSGVVDIQARLLHAVAEPYERYENLAPLLTPQDSTNGQTRFAEPMRTYDADVIWIVGPDARVLQSIGRADCEKPAAFPVASDQLPTIFSKDRFAHFFASTPQGLLELEGTAAYASEDRRAKNQPDGYFFAGRLWNQDFLRSVSEWVIGSVSLSTGNAAPPDSSQNVTLPLKDSSGKTIGVLRCEGLSALMRAYVLVSKVRLALIVTVCLTMVALFWWALMHWVTGPLSAISSSLASEDASSVEWLQDDESELGNIARMLKQFLEQKEMLTKEIRERKKIEETLRIERDQTQRYLDVAKVMIAAVDCEGHTTLINQTGCEILGYSENELIGSNWIDRFFEPDVHPQARKRLHSVTSGETPPTGYFEHPVITKSGERRTVAFYTTVTQDEAGAITGILFSGRDITESLRAHEALQASEDRYRLLMDAAYDAIFIADTGTGMLIDANQKALSLSGRTLDEIRRMKHWDLHPPEERERAKALLEVHAMKGSGIVKDLRMLCRDGRLIPVEISTSTTEIDGHRLSQGTFRDITERRRYEEALSKSEERFRKYFELPLVGIAMISPQFHWVVVNDKLCEILGYPREELGRIFWTDLTPEEDRQAETEAYEKIVAGERHAHTIEKRFIRKDGSIIYAQVSALPVCKTTGEIDYFIAVIQDITERKEVEEALRSSERNFRTLFNHAGDAIFIRNLAGRFIEVNEEACTRLGYTRDELLSKTIADIEPRTSQSLVEERLGRLRRTGHVVFESEYACKDGTRVPVEANVRLFEFNGVPAILSICRDITDRRKAAEQRSELEGQLRQAQKIESIGRLAGGIAHDFNNLLTPIIGYAEVVLMTMDDPSDAHDNVQQILVAAERAKDLTRQLLAFSRKQVLEMKVLQLNSVVSDFEKMMRRLIGEDIEVITRFDSRLGSIKADPAQIQQILVNLAVNARDAMPTGGRLMIETSNVILDQYYELTHPGLKAGAYVMLSFCDTGIGMSPEVKAHIFEPFFTTKEQGKGTGLGLATVYGIVKQHEGGIWVYSELGRGTIFKIYIPRVDALPEAEEGIIGKPGMRGSETVMVVEDDRMVRDLTCEILAEHGYDVIGTEDPRDALRIAGEHPGAIHLLLTDVIMPEMNGRELFVQIVKNRPEMRVLYMSGYTGEIIAHHGILDDKVQFLQKPFSVHDLTQRIRNILNQEVN